MHAGEYRQFKPLRHSAFCFYFIDQRRRARTSLIDFFPNSSPKGCRIKVIGSPIMQIKGSESRKIDRRNALWRSSFALSCLIVSETNLFIENQKHVESKAEKAVASCCYCKQKWNGASVNNILLLFEISIVDNILAIFFRDCSSFISAFRLLGESYSSFMFCFLFIFGLSAESYFSWWYYFRIDIKFSVWFILHDMFLAEISIFKRNFSSVIFSVYFLFFIETSAGR